MVSAAELELIDAFCQRYYTLETAVQETITNATDSVILWRLGDDLEQFRLLFIEYSTLFIEEEQQLTLQNLAAMQHDPSVVETHHTGAPGRPAIENFEINPDFLRWAYSQRSTAQYCTILGGWVDPVVRCALLAHGIACPQQQPTTLRFYEAPVHPVPGEEAR
ncbi:hypothetical protein C8F01DRAFT_1267309 [Mycena amicta]|nr:hypothetical protein C8F01DRAFT_1267309 [Mycena amicta]